MRSLFHTYSHSILSEPSELSTSLTAQLLDNYTYRLLLKNSLVNYCLSILKLGWRSIKYEESRNPAQSHSWKKSPRSTHSSSRHDLTLTVPLPLLRTQARPRIRNRGYRKLCCYYNSVREPIGWLVIDNLFEFTSRMNYKKPRGKSSVYYLRSVKNISVEHGFWMSEELPDSIENLITLLYQKDSDVGETRHLCL